MICTDTPKNGRDAVPLRQPRPGIRCRPGTALPTAAAIDDPIEDCTIPAADGITYNIDEMACSEQTPSRRSRLMAIGELTASIAHEINQPLAAIVANATACRRWLSGKHINVAEAREALDCIARDSQRAVAIVAGIRALAQKSPSKMARVDLNQVILETLDLMRCECRHREVILNVVLGTDTGFALGDQVQLQQVILNLAKNGVDAMGSVEGQPHVLKIASRAMTSDCIEVTVADTGTGLNPEHHAKIFEAFFTTKPQGIGMGLAICRSIIEAHGGRLWMTTNAPRGSVFHLTVPRYRGEAQRCDRFCCRADD